MAWLILILFASLSLAVECRDRGRWTLASRAWLAVAVAALLAAIVIATTG